MKIRVLNKKVIRQEADSSAISYLVNKNIH